MKELFSICCGILILCILIVCPVIYELYNLLHPPLTLNSPKIHAARWDMGFGKDYDLREDRLYVKVKGKWLRLYYKKEKKQNDK